MSSPSRRRRIVYQVDMRERHSQTTSSAASAGFLTYALLLLFAVGCRQEIVPESYKPTHAHEAYLISLRQAGLENSALVRDWISLSQEALSYPIDVRPPFEEVFYVNPASAFAIGYKFSTKKGRRIEIEVAVKTLQSGRLFLDLFRIAGEPQERTLVASAGENETRLQFEPQADHQYVIRLQPELMRGGEYRVVLREAPVLAFPVSGRNSRAILSVFGVPRDAGRRQHEGIDIFAPRHTPVLAPCRARVLHVGESDLGGHVVWLYDEARRLNLYFAHLQTQDTSSGTWVEAGQQIGTVGNSGNAKTTYPHLHFGIYARGVGAIDPYYYVAETSRVPVAVSASTTALGTRMRFRAQPVSFRSSWGGIPAREPVRKLHLPLTVLAVTRDMYRVLLPDGTSGYVPAPVLEPAEGVLSRQMANIPCAITDQPADNAPALEFLGAGEEYSVLGRYDRHWLVRTSHGSTGWLHIAGDQ